MGEVRLPEEILNKPLDTVIHEVVSPQERIKERGGYLHFVGQEIEEKLQIAETDLTSEEALRAIQNTLQTQSTNECWHVFLFNTLLLVGYFLVS